MLAAGDQKAPDSSAPTGAQDDSPRHRPDRYTHLMIAGPPTWSRQRPHDGSRGFQPTGGIIQLRLRRGATLETGGADPGRPHQASRRDAITSRPSNRGLKPTATFAKSLRDRERPTYDPYHEGNYSPRDVYKDQGGALGYLMSPRRGLLLRFLELAGVAAGGRAEGRRQIKID